MIYITKIWIDFDNVFAKTDDGKIAKYAFKDFPSLKEASRAQRENFTISHCAIHWPELDEDINLEGMLYDNGICNLTDTEDSVEYRPDLEPCIAAEDFHK